MDMRVPDCCSGTATMSRADSAVPAVEALACKIRDADERDRCTAPVVRATFGVRKSQFLRLKTTDRSLASPLTLSVPFEWDMRCVSSSYLLC